MFNDIARLKQDSRGFTLLETLVAFLIASLSLTAILAGHRLAVDGGRRMESKLSAALYAQDLLSAAGASYAIEQGVVAGTEDGYQWRVEIDAFDAKDAPPYTVLKLRATVTKDAQTVMVETLRLSGTSP